VGIILVRDYFTNLSMAQAPFLIYADRPL
jgi:hypothetical protein